MITGSTRRAGAQCRSRPRSHPMSALPVLPQQPARDDRLLDLRRPLAYQQERRLAHEPLDLVLLRVAVAAMDAERVLRDLRAVLAGQELRHAGLDVVARAGVRSEERRV